MFQRIRNMVNQAFGCTAAPPVRGNRSGQAGPSANARDTPLNTSPPRTQIGGDGLAQTARASTSHVREKAGEASDSPKPHARGRRQAGSSLERESNASRSPSPSAHDGARRAAQQPAAFSHVTEAREGKARRDKSPQPRMQSGRNASPSRATPAAARTGAKTAANPKLQLSSQNSQSSKRATVTTITTTSSSNSSGHTVRRPRLGEALARAQGRKSPARLTQTSAGQSAISERTFYWPPGVTKKNLNGLATLPDGRSASGKVYCRHLVTAAAHWRLAHPGLEFDFQKHFRDQATIAQSMPQDIDGLYAHMRRHATHTHYLSMEQFGTVIDGLRKALTPEQPEHVTFLRLGGHALMLSIRADRIALFDPEDTHREARINLVPGQPSGVRLQDLLTDEQLGKYFKRIPGIMIHVLKPAEHDYVAMEKAHQKKGTVVAKHEVTFHCDLSASLLRALLYDAHYLYTALTDLPFKDKLASLAGSEGGVDKLRDILAARFEDAGLVQKKWHPYLKPFVQRAVDGSHALVDILSYMVGADMEAYEWRPNLAELKAAVLQANLPAAWKLDKLDIESLMRGGARDPFFRLMGLFVRHMPQQLSDELCARVVAGLTTQLSRQFDAAEHLDMHHVLDPARKHDKHHVRLDDAFFMFTLRENRASYPTLEGLFDFIAGALQRPPLNDEHARHLETLARVTLRGLQIQFDPDRETQYLQYAKLHRFKVEAFSNAELFPEAALKAVIKPLADALPGKAAEVHALVGRRKKTAEAF